MKFLLHPVRLLHPVCLIDTTSTHDFTRKRLIFQYDACRNILKNPMRLYGEGGFDPIVT
jgi:hypothetical protein